MELFVKDTGVIRKIDDLGRIVIPKEIRRSLGIRDGENLEIFISDKGICLQKHSRLVNYQELAIILCSFAKDIMGYNVLVFDREEVIAACENNYLHLKISSVLQKLLDTRESYESHSKEKLLQELDPSYYYALPLIVSTDVVGLILIISDNQLALEQKKFGEFLKQLIVHKLDVL